MSELISTKPYMIRAMHEWCADNNLTPHLVVAVNSGTHVPMAYVKDGEIILNINYSATKNLHIDNDAIVFSARFGGVPQNIYVPMSAVKGIFARENGQGMFFEVEDTPVGMGDPSARADAAEEPRKAADVKRPTLTVVK